MNPIMGWKAECEEWQAIAEEMVTKNNAILPVTVFQISLEQRKRMMARGQRPMTYDEICVYLASRKNGAHCKQDSSATGACGGTDETCSCECNTCEDPR